jgi:hypothetical protein
MVFSERHLLAQEHFTGISSLHAAYEGHVAAEDPPWPHVLPAEDAAARLEILSRQLVNLGYLKETLRPLAPAEVTLCSDVRSLHSLVSCMAEGAVTWRGDSMSEEGQWTLSDIPNGLGDAATTRILSEQKDFVTAVGKLMAGRDKDSIDSRAALKATAEASRQGPGATDRLKVFAASGWETHPQELSPSVTELFQTVAAAVAAIIAKDLALEDLTG